MLTIWDDKDIPAIKSKGITSMPRRMSEKGASLVEFALVLPLLLVITFGAIEFSVMLYDQQVITNAAREGARRGIVQTHTGARISEDEIEQTVHTYADNHLISFMATPAQPTIEVTCEGTAGGCPATDAFGDDLMVRVQYNFQYMVIGNLVPGLGAGITLGSTATMKCE
jgi:Flp pilus assembly protein TadG